MTGSPRPDDARLRLGIIGFHSDGSGRDPLSQSELVAAAFAAEGHAVRAASSRRPPLLRLGDQVASVIRWRGEIDVVLIDVFSGRSFVSAEATATLCRLLGVPFVLVLHGGNLPTFIAAHPRRARLLADRAARLVAPSDYLADVFRAAGHAVTVIPNLVPPSRAPSRVRERIRPSVLWMRTFEPTYRPDLAVRAFERLRSGRPDATMTMAGADHGELGATVELAGALDLGRAITFAGFVSGAAKDRLFEDHDIFLNTTRIDNTPVSVLEAGASGLAIVATDVGGLRVLLEDGRNGLLVDGSDGSDGSDGAALGDAMLRLCDDDRLARDLSARAIEMARSYSWERVRPRWLTLLSDLGLPVRPVVPADGVVAPLALRDLPRVAAIHLAAFTDSQLALLGPAVLERYYRWQFLGPHQSRAFGVWHDGELVGFVFAGRYRGAVQGFLRRNWLPLGLTLARHPGSLAGTRFRGRLREGIGVAAGRFRSGPGTGSSGPPPPSSTSAGVLSIAVHPTWAGRGVARDLLRAAERDAAERGFDRMHLTVAVDNDRAIAFYEREGWVRAANRDGSWSGAMRRSLVADAGAPEARR